MSHHDVNLFPGVAPLGRPQKTDKKRRFRRVRGGEAAALHEVEEVPGLEDIFVLEDDPDDNAPEDASPQARAGRSALTWFSGTTMKALLQAQENR